MVDHHRSRLSHQWLDAFMSVRSDAGQPPTPKDLDAIRRLTATPWEAGGLYVVAPAMTAIVAAAPALDLYRACAVKK